MSRGFTITICSSADFFNKLPRIETELINFGYSVNLPNTENFSRLPEPESTNVRRDLMRDHFRRIEESDAIYVANYYKNGITGYIGGNVFLEMGKAFDGNKPIFLMNEIPLVHYRSEIETLRPIIIGENWNDIERVLGPQKEEYPSYGNVHMPPVLDFDPKRARRP